jgi:heme/copper-type cytochrome/quinol oxidase subunit 3
MTTGLHGYPIDDPDPTPRVLLVGSRLLSASVVIFFFAFVFAFVYLKAQNSRGRWNPGLEVSVVFSTVVVGAVLLSALACGVAIRRLREDDTSAWQGWAAISVLLGVGVIGLHVWQLDTLPFTPTQGGYASVFVGWTVALIAVEVGAMYWLFSALNGTLRVAGDVDPYEEGTPPHVRHLVASAHGYWFFWRVVAAVEIVAYVLLVLVR